MPVCKYSSDFILIVSKSIKIWKSSEVLVLYFAYLFKRAFQHDRLLESGVSDCYGWIRPKMHNTDKIVLNKKRDSGAFGVSFGRTDVYDFGQKQKY